MVCYRLMGPICYYELLGVGPKASDEEIKKGYRKEARQWHPDKNPDRIEEATARFQEIQNAHDILSDPDERYLYDTDKAIDDIPDEDDHEQTNEVFVPTEPSHAGQSLYAQAEKHPSVLEGTVDMSSTSPQRVEGGLSTRFLTAELILGSVYQLTPTVSTRSDLASIRMPEIKKFSRRAFRIMCTTRMAVGVHLVSLFTHRNFLL
eukprot:COSAG05_NODE_176_length_14928_cov_75.109717_4_plen_205_part_00